MIQVLKNREFLHATSILIGTMVGVGIFGIPFAFAKAGFWVGLSFLVFIGFITYFLNLVYAEIVLRTHKPHQLIGYTQLYLGNFWKRVMFFSAILTTYAALLAYIIISGDFLVTVLSPIAYVSSNSLSFWFYAIASTLVLFGIRTVAKIEFILAILFVLVIFLIFGFGLGSIDFSNYSYVNYDFWFFPYGVLLFAFSGLSAIPIQRQILINKEGLFRKSILSAMLLVGGLYLIFGFTVLGISGESTSPDAVSGLIDFIGGKIIYLCSLFGILAVSTSYLMLGTAMMQVFSLDYGVGRKLSWLLVVAPPLVLYLGGLKNFIDVISLAGAVAIGLEAFILIIVLMKAKIHGDRIPEYSLKVPGWSLYVLALIFAGGIVFTFVTR